MNIFRNNLFAQLDKNNMTISTLSRLSGVDRATINNYTRARQLPNTKILLELCMAFKCSPNDLLLDNSRSEYRNGFRDGQNYIIERIKEFIK